MTTAVYVRVSTARQAQTQTIAAAIPPTYADVPRAGKPLPLRDLTRARAPVSRVPGPSINAV